MKRKKPAELSDLANAKALLKKEKARIWRAKRKRLHQKMMRLADEFGERLLAGEKLTIDDFLAQYPQYQEKLRPYLITEWALCQWGLAQRRRLEKYYPEIVQSIHNLMADRQIEEIQKRLEKAQQKKSLSLKLRSEFIPILLYLKGKTHRIGEGIRGITRFIKLLFLIKQETKYAKLVKPFYHFVPYKMGPFDPAIYQDIQILEAAGVIQKQTYTYHLPSNELTLDEGFNLNNQATLYTLTERGRQYAQALVNWLNQKDPQITETMRRYKTYYAQAPLKKLLEYIYKKYPQYTTESEILKQILNQ